MMNGNVQINHMMTDTFMIPQSLEMHHPTDTKALNVLEQVKAKLNSVQR